MCAKLPAAEGVNEWLALRRKLGWCRAKMAEELKTSPALLRAIEYGVAVPDERLAEAFQEVQSTSPR
jgi:ribosome-binding protein aMBF1 (putative translation factor)